MKTIPIKIKNEITSADLEYKRLIMIYALVRLAWEKNVLIIGLIKDTAAAELTKMIVPILQNAQKINIFTCRRSRQESCPTSIPISSFCRHLVQSMENLLSIHGEPLSLIHASEQ